MYAKVKTNAAMLILNLYSRDVDGQGNSQSRIYNYYAVFFYGKIYGVSDTENEVKIRGIARKKWPLNKSRENGGCGKNSNFSSSIFAIETARIS